MVKNENSLSQLCDYARQLGSDIAMVQGGGGNVSYKDTLDIWIKPSGIRFDELNHQNYARLKREPVATYFQTSLIEINNPTIEKEASLVIKSAHLDDTPRPSMETGFHAVIPYPFIIHTHPVIANLLNCSQEGEAIVKELFPSATYIPYETPGTPLSFAIAKEPSSTLYFLENHGLIVAGNTLEETIDLHQDALNQIQKYFKLTTPQLSPLSLDEVDFDYLLDTPLFPDQIIYTESFRNNRDALQGRATLETVSAWQYIHDTIKSLGLTLRTLPREKAESLINLESEKYRLTLLK